MPRTSRRKGGNSKGAPVTPRTSRAASSSNVLEKQGGVESPSASHANRISSSTSSPSEVKVTGARMSGVKHSGLLAKDVEEL